RTCVRRAPSYPGSIELPQPCCARQRAGRRLIPADTSETLSSTFTISRIGDTMAQIRHIAIASDHPGKTADFYKKAFGVREVARNGFDPSKPDIAPRPCSVLMTDGYL